MTWCFIAMVAIRQTAAEGDTPCLLRRPAKSQAVSHHSWLNESRGTGRIHSVTVVCPSTIKGLRLAWISAFPVGRSAWIQMEVSTRYIGGPFVPLGAELDRRQIERNRAQHISQFL